MSDLNKIMIIGRLTRDPILTQTKSGSSIAGFSIANNKTYTKNGEKAEQVSFFECSAWGKIGEIISQYCKKGQKIGIDGRLQQQSWQNNEGIKKYKVSIVVDNFQFLSPKSQEQNSDNQELSKETYPPVDNIPF